MSVLEGQSRINEDYTPRSRLNEAQAELLRIDPWVSIDEVVSKKCGITKTGLQINCLGSSLRYLDTTTTKPLPTVYLQNGYPAIKLYGQRFYLHELAFYAYNRSCIEKSADYRILHLKSDKEDPLFNCVDNLMQIPISRSQTARKKRARSPPSPSSADESSAKRQMVVCPNCAFHF